MAVKVKDVYIDFETYCEQPIKEVGAWRYGMDPSCEVLCLAYSLDGDSTRLWHPGLPEPEDLLEAVADGARVHAWNATFEYIIWNYVQTHWPTLKPSQIRCTMALAAYHSLPLALEKAGHAVGASIKKDKEGTRLLRKFSVPRKPTKNNPSTRILPEDDPEDFRKLCDYCVTDVDAEIAIMDELPLSALPSFEQKIYELDLAINERGVKVDLPAVKAVIDASAKIGEVFEAKAGKIIGEDIRTSQRAEVMRWAEETHGFIMENYTAGYIKELLAGDDLPEDVRRVLEIRSSLAKTSVTKYNKMLMCAGVDGRVRGTIQYYGAQRTGRFAGRLLQVHNLPRGSVKGIELVAPYAHAWTADDLLILFDEPMEALSSLIRSMIIAAAGEKFYVADFANIEGRVLAWMAGQEDVVAQFAAGDDLYKHMAATIFGVTYHTVDDFQRFVGKQAVLGCFGPETLVVTARGAVPIVAVQPDDLLWDGIEWVSHDGVINQGIRETIDVEGIRVTPDHGIYVDEGVMVPAAEVDWARAHTFGGLPAVENPSENCCLYHELFSYDLATGELRHRERPDHMFDNAGAARCWNNRFAGELAGWVNHATGYRQVNVRRGWREHAHSIVWEMVYGHPPRTEVDHENGNKDDHRLCNLRLASGAQNSANGASRRTNTSGFIGVRPYCGQWEARIGSGVPGRHVHVGLFDTPEAAAHARDKAAVAIYGPYTSLNFMENRDRCVYDILNAGPRHRFAIITAQGIDIATNCGYGMGGPKFHSTCVGYGQDIGLPLAKKAVSTYRKKNSKIVKFWYAVDEAAKNAVRQPGMKFTCRDVEFLCKAGYLWIKLPSKRVLAYKDPRVEDGRLTYMGQNQTTNQWCRQDTYGGKLVENIVQAVSRDIMAAAMVRAEEADYRVLMTVHDEIISTNADDHASVEEFSAILCEIPIWAKGCPIDASGWTGTRYKKD